MATSTITLAQLHGAVHAAVKTATEKHKLRLQSEVAIGPGILCGPLLRAEAVTLDTAHQVADEIAQAAEKAMGGQAQGAAALTAKLRPGVLISDRLILCGFWPPFPILELGKEIGGSGPV